MHIETSQITDEASRIQEQGFLNRKGRLKDLFAYLVTQSSETHAPTETMIAADVFGKTVFSGAGDDATVRVYIHRLRTRLAKHYQDNPSIEAKSLTLTKGEYRLVLSQVSTPIQSQTQTHRQAKPKRLNWSLWAASLVAILTLNIAALSLFNPTPKAIPDAHPIWEAFSKTTVPTMIVVGDYYIYQPAPFDDAPQQLIRDFAINSAQDLQAAQRNYPDDYLGTQNIDLHYLPVSTAYALAKLSPSLKSSVDSAFTKARPSLKVMKSSDVTAATLKEYNIVYIGLFSGLNKLSRTAFETSNFVKGQSYDQIIDVETGIEYDSSEIKSVTEQEQYLDYGYFAQFEGPGGNLMTIIAGTRDTGLQGVSDILATQDITNDTRSRWSEGSRFEALYEVKGEDRQNLKQTLLASYFK